MFKLLTTLGVSVGVSEKAILIALQKTVAKRPVEPPEAWVVRTNRKNGFNVVPKVRVGTQIIDANVPLDAKAGVLIEIDEKVPTISDPALLDNIAVLFGVEKSTVLKLRRCGNLFSLIDVASMVTGKNQHYAAEQIRIIRETKSAFKMTDWIFLGKASARRPPAIFTLLWS